MSGSDPLEERLRKIQLFLCDVDGVLTDGTVWMGSGGEQKRFHIRDGFSLRFLQQAGIRVGWISARPSPATTERAQDLKIDFLRQSPEPKAAVVEALLRKLNLSWDQVSFIGDDLLDLGVLRRVGLAAAPSDAVSEVREQAHYVCRNPGGGGAVREVVELILKAQGHWEATVAKFAS